MILVQPHGSSRFVYKQRTGLWILRVGVAAVLSEGFGFGSGAGFGVCATPGQGWSGLSETVELVWGGAAHGAEGGRVYTHGREQSCVCIESKVVCKIPLFRETRDAMYLLQIKALKTYSIFKTAHFY